MRTSSRPGQWLVVGWLVVFAAGCGGDGGGGKSGVALDVSAYFPAGTAVRDAYSGQTATVGADGKVTVKPASGGVVLLEKDGAAPTPFTWKNAVVYFALTDRFQNGDPTNDHSYGRKSDGASEIGTWHGGDLKGLTEKLDYVASLGATAIWISPIVEQVHGWVAGGTAGDFRHYAYHGYWALDFTQLDANWGTPADLQAFVDAAHARGIRVLVDVVMNHPGYATGADLVEYLPAVFKDGTGAAFQAYDAHPTANLNDWTNLVDYTSPAWTGWWGVNWIRAGIGPKGTYVLPGSDDLTKSLSFLPDFRTESTTVAGRPPLLVTKDGPAFPELPNGTVREYLVKWHTDWVRQYGIDGFRCDTAKHVELASWSALKDAGTAALADWKAANPTKKLDDAPFWMVGEVFPHGVAKDAYFTDGKFDALINTGFQDSLLSVFVNNGSIVAGAQDLDAIYNGYASRISTDPSFDALSYISSHDTRIFFDARGKSPVDQRQAGTALLLAPGSVQVFYGDESGRKSGSAGSDAVQATRSDMNWTTIDQSILDHWTKLASFRKRHAAVGAGAHQRLESPSGTYAFGRKLSGDAGDDAVVVLVTQE